MTIKNQLMLINETSDETRIAITTDARLEELQVEQKAKIQLKGNIYRGTVVQIEPSLQAAFVDFGEEKNGFLAMDEVNFRLFPNQSAGGSGLKARLKIGQPILVQITRDPIQQKGAALTTFVTLAGRYLNYLPSQKNSFGMSKKIEQTKEKLKVYLQSLTGENDSVYLRTYTSDLHALSQDVQHLKNTWDKLEAGFHESKKPGLIYQEIDLSLRMIRDYYNDEVEAVWIDNPETFQQVYDYFEAQIPARIRDLKLFNQKQPIFHHFGVEEQVEALSHRMVPLQSGGTICIDPTEALVAIDVNSAKALGQSNNADTAYHTNLEAAEEVARQLRLRNLGGLIVVDFIDMEKKEWIRDVENTLATAMALDKAQHNLGAISEFGLLELSRQRISQGFAQSMEAPCEACHGLGRVPNVVAAANQILRKFRKIAAEKEVASIAADALPSVANYLLNEKRFELSRLESEFGIQLYVRSTVELDGLESRFTTQSKAGKKISEWEKPIQRPEIQRRHKPLQADKPKFSPVDSDSDSTEPRVSAVRNAEGTLVNRARPERPSFAPRLGHKEANGLERAPRNVRGGFNRPLVQPEVITMSCLFEKNGPIAFPWARYDSAQDRIMEAKSQSGLNLYPSAYIFANPSPLKLAETRRRARV